MSGVAKVTITKKHKYSMGTPDAGGNKMIYVTGQITIATEAYSASGNLTLDLSDDIPNVEGVFIQGDAGFVVQYAYDTKQIEIYNEVAATSATALAASTASSLADKVFHFHAWGF